MCMLSRKSKLWDLLYVHVHVPEKSFTVGDSHGSNLHVVYLANVDRLVYCHQSYYREF